jgi:hypothetical protein
MTRSGSDCTEAGGGPTTVPARGSSAGVAKCERLHSSFARGLERQAPLTVNIAVNSLSTTIGASLRRGPLRFALVGLEGLGNAASVVTIAASSVATSGHFGPRVLTPRPRNGFTVGPGRLQARNAADS